MQVLHVDCGVHTEGRQIRLFHEWFSRLVNLKILAFEASPRHFRKPLQIWRTFRTWIFATSPW